MLGKAYTIKVQGKLRKQLVFTVYMESDTIFCIEKEEKLLIREGINQKTNKCLVFARFGQYEEKRFTTF